MAKKKLGIPTKVVLNASELGLADNELNNFELVEEIVSDYISDLFGFLHYGFRFIVKGTNIIVSNIRWCFD